MTNYINLKYVNKLNGIQAERTSDGVSEYFAPQSEKHKQAVAGAFGPIEPYTPPPEPTPEQILEAKRAAAQKQVNTERTRRLEQGTTIDVTGYGPVAVQGRDQDQITILALEASARDLTAAGVTDPVIPFRDRDNVQHMLTPEQTTELMRKAKAFAQKIYQASWALKDANPIPLDYTDDKHWPEITE